MIINICGLMGAGKSTLVKNLSTENGYTVYYEPVNDNPFLVDYYKEQTRWAFSSQVYYLWERYKQSQEAFLQSLRGETVIIDSSVYSDLVFVLVQNQANYFTEGEFNTYINMHKILSSQMATPDLVIWLELKPEQAMERIKKRSRECESGVKLEYLQRLYSAYQDVLGRIEKHANVVRIDATPDSNSVRDSVCSLIDALKAKQSQDILTYL